jgi:hypothetical protein
MTMQIFDSKGVFQELPPDVADSLDDVRAAAYQKLRACAAVLQAADTAAADTGQSVKRCNAAVIEFENFMRKAPKMTFHDLWKENYQRIT